MQTLNGYLSDLASEKPAPGGGSAAMVVGAAGCALVAMVARICAASPKYAAVAERAAWLASSAERLRERMLELREQDESAFAAVVAARGDKIAMQKALAGAAEAPLAGAKSALEALQFAHGALELGNPNLVSDVGCAAEFAHAAMLACAYNVRINHKFMKDEETVARQRSQLQELERDAKPLLDAVRSAMSRALP